MSRLSLQQIEDLAYAALTACRTDPANARIVAASIAAAEADGIASHGLLRLPTYCAHARTGKVDGFAQPAMTAAGAAVIQVDACNGFAHPAIDLAVRPLVELCREHGVALASIRNSYNSGVMGHHVERLATAGLVGLGFSNAPATIAPWGGRAPVFGTNPIAFAAPRPDAPPIVVDQAASVIARGEVMLRAQRGESVPDSWGFDAEGSPTSDPGAILRGGSMAPAGGRKGVSLALIVEVFAAVLSGPLLSVDAGSLTECDGRFAGIGQLFVAVDPGKLSDDYAQRIQRLATIIEAQHPARLPGSARQAHRISATQRGVEVSDELLARLNEVCR